MAVSKFEEYFRVKNIYGPEESVNHGRDDIRNAVWRGIRLSATSWPRLAVQCPRSNVFIAYRSKPRPWIVWPEWWPWIRWRVIRRWRQTFAQFATRQSSRRRPQSPVQHVTRQNFRRHLRGRWTQQSRLAREIEWRICGRRVQILRFASGTLHLLLRPSCTRTTSILFKPDIHNTSAERDSLADHAEVLWSCGADLVFQYTARCEVCIEVGSSPFLSSSESHEIVLSVAMSARLRHVP